MVGESNSSEDIHALIGLVKNSDRKAFKELFDFFWEPLSVYAYSILDDKDAAKDLIQDLWITIWQKRRDLIISNFKAYIYTALRNKCYSYLRDQKFTRLQEETLTKLEQIENASADEDLFERMRALLSKSIQELPPKCKEIFELSRINGFSNDEISSILGISKKTVENNITKALNKLRNDYGNLHYLIAILLG